MGNSVKIAISIPDRDYKDLEKVRKEKGLSRSAIIDEAIQYWLKSKQKRQMIKQYQEGYKKIPENISDLKVFQKEQLQVLDSKEDWS